MKNWSGPGVDGMHMDMDDNRLHSDILPDNLPLPDVQARMYRLHPRNALGKGEGPQPGYTLESRAVATATVAGLTPGLLRLGLLLPSSAKVARSLVPGRTTLEVDL